mgnify:CR=1 FL=1
MAEKVCHKLNKSLAHYLPGVAHTETALGKLQMRFEQKLSLDTERRSQEDHVLTDLQDLKFKINTIHSEIEYQKKIFNAKRLAEMEATAHQVKSYGYEIELIKINLENSASKEQV